MAAAKQQLMKLQQQPKQQLQHKQPKQLLSVAGHRLYSRQRNLNHIHFCVGNLWIGQRFRLLYHKALLHCIFGTCAKSIKTKVSEHITDFNGDGRSRLISCLIHPKL